MSEAIGVFRAVAVKPGVCLVLSLFSCLPLCVRASTLPARELQPGLQMSIDGSFYADTAGHVRWPETKPPGIRTWICNWGFKRNLPGRATSGTFYAAKEITLYMAGDPSNSARLFLENASTGAKMRLAPAEMLSGTWLLLHFKLPASWRRQPLRLVAEVDGAPQDRWMGFSEPVLLPESSHLSAFFSVLFRALLYFGLLSLPFAAAVSLAADRGVNGGPSLVVLGLACLGASGYLAFWLWFIHPRIGLAFDLFLPSICAAYLVRFVRRSSPARRGCLLVVLQPWLLMFAAVLFLLFAGFLYGGIHNPLATAQVRYRPFFLPADNVLPSLFAEELAHRKFVHPFFIDWLTSDRPPLQTGFDLLLYPFLVTPRELRNEITGVLVQSFWIPALWAFLRALKVSKRPIVCAISGLVFSQFVLLNSFFVWPKLLAAAFLVAGSALLLSMSDAAADRRARAVSAPASGACLCFGLLAHGGVVFSLTGLALALAVRSSRARARSLALAAVACILLYLPWTAYQKFYDPPGDRLLKWHLAGVQQVDKRPFLEVLRSSYARLTWRQIVDYRESNLQMIFGSQREYWNSARSFIEALPHDITHEQKLGGASAGALSTLQFFYVQPALGLFVFGPLFLAAGFWRRFRTPLWRAASLCWIYFAGTTISWLALMFKPDSTTLHQGSYASILLAVAGSVLAFWNVSRRFAVAAVLLQSAFSVLVSVVYSRGVAAPGNLAEGIFDPASLILLAAAVAVLALSGVTSHRVSPWLGRGARPLHSRLPLAPSRA